jgi:two-component SAPR family response regulator
MPAKPDTPVILLVEDEWLIAVSVQNVLEETGMSVVGPVPNVDAALALLEKEKIDAAILNVRLGERFSFPVAQRLIEMSIPFIFLTSESMIPSPFDEHPRLSKPFDMKALVAAITKAMEIVTSRTV